MTLRVGLDTKHSMMQQSSEELKNCGLVTLDKDFYSFFTVTKISMNI